MVEKCIECKYFENVDHEFRLGNCVLHGARLTASTCSDFTPKTPEKSTREAKNGLRMCYILAKGSRLERKALFHSWTTEAYVEQAIFKGEVGGQYSYTYGIVEFEDGTVRKVDPECIRFERHIRE